MNDYVLIFNEIKIEIIELMKDASGNYIIQILIEMKIKEAINTILEKLKGNIFEISINTYSCWVL